MKARIRYSLWFICLLAVTLPARAQGLLGIGSSGIIGLPDTTHFGDVIQNMHVWVVNRGNTIVSGLTVQLMAAPNLLGNPFSIGTLDLTLGLLPPGDSTYVPLNSYTVSPQSSNSGSNVMVIWPTAPGTTPSDSTHDDYWVDGTTMATTPAQGEVGNYLYPSPSAGLVQLHLSKPIGPEAELWIYQANGKLLEKSKVQTASTIDLSHLRSGTYFYQVISDHGSSIRGKFMIQKE